MKVLHQNRKTDSWIGGDVVQMNHTMSELVKLGLDVSFSHDPLFKPAALLSDFDIVHLWNFSMPWTKYQVWAAKRQGRKVVCSMIYHETEAFIPYNFQQIMIDQVDACIFLTQGEVDRARRHLTIPDHKVHIIPNGIDLFWLLEKKQTWEKKGYALTVGRLDGSKGQLEVATACRRLGLEYVCIGERINESYARSCEAEGAIILESRSQKELIPIYDNAAVHVLASNAEIFPLTVMEAGARGVHSVVATSCEWKDIPNVTWCIHGDIASIEGAIQQSLKIKKNGKFKAKLKKMTWAAVGKSVMELYNKLYA